MLNVLSTISFFLVFFTMNANAGGMAAGNANFNSSVSNDSVNIEVYYKSDYETELLEFIGFITSNNQKFEVYRNPETEEILILLNDETVD